MDALQILDSLPTATIKILHTQWIKNRIALGQVAHGTAAALIEADAEIAAIEKVLNARGVK